MRRRTLLVKLSLFVLAGSLQLAGCDRKPAGPPPIEKATVVGEWLEIDPAEFGNVRIQSAEPLEYHRHVVLSEDGTFEFNLLKKSGEPRGSKKITGTWDVDVKKNEIVFAVTENQFATGDEQHGWAPSASTGVRKDKLKKEGQTDAITIIDTAGEPVSYKRIK